MPATSLPLLLLLLACAAAAPVRYDQRQEGDFNVHAHLENFVVVLIPTSGGGGGGLGLIDMLKKAGASVRTAEQPLQVAVVGVPPKEEEQRKEDPQLEAQPQPQPQPQQQQQREAVEEDLQPAGSQAMEAVLVAESLALLLARAEPAQSAHAQDQPAAAQQQRQQRAGRAMAGRADGCPQGQFRDATGVCHHIGSDQRVGNQFYFGLEPPLES